MESKAQSEAEPLKKKKPPPRPLVRIVLLLMSHRVIVSLLCCIAGVIALLLLPVLAKNTYISENALMPGSANPMLSGQDVLDADKLVADIMSLSLEPNAGREIPKMLIKRVEDLGGEASQFQFYPQPNKFHPLHFFSSQGNDLHQENMSCISPAISTVGIIRAPQGDGKEAIILVTPFNAVKLDAGEAVSLGVAYSVFSLLSKVTWLAKDIIWLAADSRYGEYESVASWLREYYAPTFDSSLKSHPNMCSTSSHGLEIVENHFVGEESLESFRRAGTMAAALVIKVTDGNRHAKDSLSIYAEASNGQMPNLDLINVVNYLAVHRQGLHVRVGKFWSLLESKYLKMVGEIIEFLGNLVGSLNPQWAFGIPAAEYVEGTATLACSLYAQALGVPTGSHGAFRDYQIDAVTLAISPKASLYSSGKRSDFLLRSGRLVEGVIRSVNNLLEKFHQSFFLYLLTGPSKFVSVGVYMIAFALLVAPLPVVAASLYSDAITSSPKSDSVKSSASPSSSIAMDISHTSWRWLHAVKTVFVVHIWGVLVALLPYFICQIPNSTSTSCISSWILVSSLSLHVFYKVWGSPYLSFKSSLQEWAILKSVMIAAAFIGLSLMSIVNFAAAEMGALLLVPFCLMVQPLKLDMHDRSLKALCRIGCNVVFGLSLFPPVAYFVAKGFTEGFSSTDIIDFWTWVESLWLWNSATYIYVMLVHLPSWVLCIHILLYPC